MSQPVNVLFILSEHHNPFFLGCQGNGIVQTPNLDRLAAEGALFEYTYCASPHCVPARGALWSGRHSHETGVWCNSTPWDGTSGGWSFHLREQGADVVTVGKLDFTPAVDHGMSREIIPRHRASLDIHSLYREQPILPRYKDMETIRGNRRRTDYPERTVDDETLDAAAAWLRQERPADRPWLLNVNFMKVHPPWSAPADVWDRYEPRVNAAGLPTKYQPEAVSDHPYFKAFMRHALHDYVTPDDIRRGHVGMYAACDMLDHKVGALVDLLEELDLLDSTMIVYSADHGASVHAHGCWTLLNPWEDSARVPLIIRHPKGKRGVIDSGPTHHHDIFPTIARAMGFEPPSGFQGVPLDAAVLEGDISCRRESVLMQIHNNGWPGGVFAVSDAEWKLIECAGERPLLFNLTEDPEELDDLMVSRPGDPDVQAQLARMRALLAETCSPADVDEQARADQRRLRAELAKTGQLEREVVKRGYLPRTDRLVPDPKVLAELDVRPV